MNYFIGSGIGKQTDNFLPGFILHSSCPSFQWKPHAPLPLFQEVHILYFLLLQVVVYAARSLVSKITGFLVTYSWISFMWYLGGFPLEPVTFEVQSFCIWLFLTHLWKVTFDLADEPLTKPILSQISSKPCGLTTQWPQCMTSEVKAGIETSPCL